MNNLMQNLNNEIKTLPMAYSIQRLIFDERGSITECVFSEWNIPFEKLTGLPSEAILGKSALDVLPDIRTGFPDWFSFFSKIVTDETTQTCLAFEAKSAHWYSVTGVYQDFASFVLIFQNISGKKAKAEQSESRKEKIRFLIEDINLIFSDLQDALAILTVENGEIRYICNNLRHQSLTGFSSESIYGKTLSAVWGEDSGSEQAEKYSTLLSHHVKEYKSEIVFETSGEKRTYSRKISFAYKNETISYILEVISDITAQKRVVQEKDELFECFHAMFDANNAIMTIVDPESQLVLHANPAARRYFGDSEEQEHYRPIHEFHVLSPDEIRTIHQRILAGKVHGYQAHFRVKSGEIRLVEVFSSPFIYQSKVCLFSILFDITDREDFRVQLQEERDLLNITLGSIGDCVVTTDDQGRITHMNQVSEQITGWREHEVLDKLFSEVFIIRNEVTGQLVNNPVDQVLKTGSAVALEKHAVLINKHGWEIPIADSAAPIRDKNGTIYGVVIVFRDISAEKQHERDMLYLSYHDALTNLYNRRFAEEELHRFDTQRQFPLSIILGDVNGLKMINDIFGHSTGDQLLETIAQTIEVCCREEDIIARWGGDEFIIILPETSSNDAENLIDRIQESIAQNTCEGLPLSLSLGAAVKTKESDDIRQIMNSAEDRMYQAKLIESKAHKKRIIGIMFSLLPETKAHSDRLRQLCMRMGQALGFSRTELEEIALFAELHNIGYIAIPREILQKTTALTPEDWEEIKHHPAIGYRIALNDPELLPVAELILSHHEFWNGEGYPRGISGTNIPLAARILAVADAYDAMTNGREYRKAIDKTAAIEELHRCAGTQFDPDVVNLFGRLISRKRSG